MLGSCPTCGGQVASSASACPHCGETEFEVDTREATESRSCPDCGGRGYYWKEASSHTHPGTGEHKFFKADWEWCVRCFMTGVILDNVVYKRDQRTGTTRRVVFGQTSGEYGGFPRKPKP